MRNHISTKEISDQFKVNHRYLMKIVRDIISSDPELFYSYFHKSSYISKQNKSIAMYDMGCDGFQILTSSNLMSRGESAMTKARILNEFGSDCYVVAQKGSRFEDSYYNLLCDFCPDVKIIRQFPVIGMRVDFYLEGFGIFIEYDEEQHLSASHKVKDEDRWAAISKHLTEIYMSKPWLIRVRKGNEIESLRAIAGVMSIVCDHDLRLALDEKSKIVRV